jgi:LPS O-antigen subunit length determinant protein (WzzB/FepE family)
MPLKDKLNENVTWQQIGITIGILATSAGLVIGLISSKVDRVDAKVDTIVTSNNEAFVKIADNTSAIRTSNEDMKSKVDEMFRSYLQSSRRSSESAITISNQN